MPFLAFVVLACLVTSPVHAADIKVQTRIDAVTVFPSGAEITRAGETTLAAGEHVLIVEDLPAGIDGDSIRVEGELTGAVEIGSIDTKQIFIRQPGQGDVADESERKRLEREIERLQDEKAALQGVIEAAEAQKALAQNLARLPLGGQQPGSRADAAPVDWKVLFDLIGDRMQGIGSAIHEAKLKQRAIEKNIAELSERLNREPPAEAERTEVRIHLEAQGEAKGRIRIRYRSNEAAWQPIYDARLTSATKDKPASLVIARRASIEQSTGEDWDNVALTLSTARPGEATAPPKLASLQIDFRPPPQPKPVAAPIAPRMAVPDQDRLRSAMPEAAGTDEEAVMQRKLMPAPERSAEVEASAYQAVFKIGGKVSVKNGVGAKKVLIGTEKIEPAVKIVTVPKLSAAAFVNAGFTLDSDAALLPGEVSLYRDGVFIGKGQLPLIADGQEHDLGFGVDDAIRVSRINVKREKGETGLLTSSNTDEQHFRITLKNLRKGPVTVTAIDQMPFSEDEKIVVEMLPLTTQPVEINHENRRGVLAWDVVLQPGEEKTINLSYQVTWPAKREIITIERHDAR